MQNKKVTMLAAVLAVTVIAMAGVGYAISYTATTTNSGNTMDSTYVVLTQQSKESAAYGGQFLTNLYFNTVNETTEANVKYTPVYTGTLVGDVYTADESVTAATQHAVALISKDLTLKVAPSKEETDKTGSLKVTLSGTFAEKDGLTYQMLLTGTDAGNDYKQTQSYSNGWTFTGVDMDAEHTYSVKLFISLSGNPVTVPDTGFAKPDANPAEETIFTFVLTA